VHKSWFRWLLKKFSEVAPQTSPDIVFGPLSEMLGNHCRRGIGTPDLTQYAIGSPSLHPNKISTLSAVLAQRSRVRDWHTTLREHRSQLIGRVVHVEHVMRPKKKRFNSYHISLQELGQQTVKIVRVWPTLLSRHVIAPPALLALCCHYLPWPNDLHIYTWLYTFCRCNCIPKWTF